MGNVIAQYIQLLDKIESMASELSGVTPQRQGAISSTELVGNVVAGGTPPTAEDVANVLTEQELADALGVTRQSVSSWERGKNLPDIETIVCISETHGISLDTLILGKDGKSEMKEKLMRDGADGAREQRYELAAAMGAVLMLAGIALWFVKAHTVEYIDAEGILHESFWLIPAGWLFVFLGASVVLVSVIGFVRLRKRGNKEED